MNKNRFFKTKYFCEKNRFLFLFCFVSHFKSVFFKFKLFVIFDRLLFGCSQKVCGQSQSRLSCSCRGLFCRSINNYYYYFFFCFFFRHVFVLFFFRLFINVSQINFSFVLGWHWTRRATRKCCLDEHRKNQYPW